MPPADWDLAKRGHVVPDAELNADITSLEHMHSVSELSVCVRDSDNSEHVSGGSTGVLRPTGRSLSITRPTPSVS